MVLGFGGLERKGLEAYAFCLSGAYVLWAYGFHRISGHAAYAKKMCSDLVGCRVPLHSPLDRRVLILIMGFLSKDQRIRGFARPVFYFTHVFVIAS